MAGKLSKYQKLQRKYVSKTKSLYTSKDGQELSTILANGENSYLKFNRFESSSMDMAWIKRIIDCIPQISEIIANPKKTIQTLAEVVQVEKVKKIGSETVQHLSSHTQFIKTVDENGEVTPSKLLNIYSDDFYAIYENKFVATLIRKLLVFVEKRYEFIMNSATMSDVSLLYMKNHTQVDDTVIDIETKVRYSHPADASAAERMRGYIKQIEDIRKYLKFYMHSEFMNILRREKDVRNPILQTNIIRKNPKYHKCYLLWLFIERYRESGIEVKVEENYANLQPDEIKELNQVMCANFLTLKGKDITRKTTKKLKVYKPKILSTYDDVIYKPAYYDGPVEYVRVDDKYRTYTEALYELDPHPTRPVAEYEKERYAENKKLREQTKQIDSLLARKEQEKARYEKGEAQAEQREKDRDAYVDALAEKEIREEAIAKVEKARKELVKQAKKNEPKEEKPKKAKPIKKAKPVKEEPKKEEKPAPIEEVKPEPVPVVEELHIEPAPAIEEPIVEEAPIEKPKIEEEVKPEPTPVVEEPVQKEEPAAEPEPTPVEEPKPTSIPKSSKKKAKKEKPEVFQPLGSFRSKKK